MRYDKLKRRPAQFLVLISLSVPDFDYLLAHFKGEWDEYNAHFTLEGKIRQRLFYPRKDSVLPSAGDKLLFLLVFLKTNPLQEHHGASFGLTQSQTNLWIHRLSDILRKTLKHLGELPERNEYRVKYIIQNFEDVLLDGTERPIERPSDNDRQKACYSGKKKLTA
jgi:hypothetical protein